MRSGTWNVRSLYRAGSLTGAARELARYKLDLFGVLEVRWDREYEQRITTFSMKRKAYTGFCWGNLREMDHLRDPAVHVRIILRWFFMKWDVVVWTGSSWLRIGTLVNAVMNLRVP
jgi:hypothetical protein